MQKLREPEKRQSGKTAAKFRYLHPVLLKDSHNTFSDFVRFTILEEKEEVFGVRGFRPIGMEKEVAEQKYIHYLTTNI